MMKYEIVNFKPNVYFNLNFMQIEMDLTEGCR